MSEEKTTESVAAEQEPTAKRLRSSDHDLKIIVKSSNTSANGENGEPTSMIEKEYQDVTAVLTENIAGQLLISHTEASAPFLGIDRRSHFPLNETMIMTG
jgi:hypothetical protein